MQIIPMFLKELEQEAQTTRKFLSIVPNDKFDWQPHPKSMTIRQLATHIAELPGWVSMTIATDGLDFAVSPYSPEVLNNPTELVENLESNLIGSYASLEQTNEDLLNELWTLRNGDHIINVRPKAEVIRMTLNQITHHRAQLGVYLRLLNIPIPGSYGPSADEMEMVAKAQEA